MADDKSGCGEKRAAAKPAAMFGAAAAFCDFFCIAAKIFKNVVLLVFYLAVALPLAFILWNFLLS